MDTLEGKSESFGVVVRVCFPVLGGVFHSCSKRETGTGIIEGLAGLHVCGMRIPLLPPGTFFKAAVVTDV